MAGISFLHLRNIPLSSGELYCYSEIGSQSNRCFCLKTIWFGFPQFNCYVAEYAFIFICLLSVPRASFAVPWCSSSILESSRSVFHQIWSLLRFTSVSPFCTPAGPYTKLSLYVSYLLTLSLFNVSVLHSTFWPTF